MQFSRKFTLVTAAACLFGIAMAVESNAQSRPDPYSLYQDQNVRPEGQHVSSYRGRDGAYGSESDYVRDVEGIPCGIACERRAQER
jgi:hypothetical protein